MSDRLWTASDGIYRSVLLDGDEGVIAFDTFWSPAAAGSYRTAIERVLPGREIHTVIYSHEHLDHCGFASDLAPEPEALLAALGAHKYVQIYQRSDLLRYVFWSRTGSSRPAASRGDR